MRKLLKGIVDFRENKREKNRKTFARLALGQTPDSLFIACSDSRVAVNVFASTNPGEMFVMRNVGNLVPPPQQDTHEGEAVAAALDYAVEVLKVKDIIVCGHSHCGAMIAVMRGRQKAPTPALQRWLRFAEPALARLGRKPENEDEVGRINVLAQLEHLKQHQSVAKGVRAGRLGIHGLFFDLRELDVQYIDPIEAVWHPLDRKTARMLLKRMEHPPVKAPKARKAAAGEPARK
jgi:carbonic anhydrase